MLIIIFKRKFMQICWATHLLYDTPFDCVYLLQGLYVWFMCCLCQGSLSSNCLYSFTDLITDDCIC